MIVDSVTHVSGPNDWRYEYLRTMKGGVPGVTRGSRAGFAQACDGPISIKKPPSSPIITLDSAKRGDYLV